MLKYKSNKLLNKTKQLKAFTIVELLIVIVVIGILAAITIVSFGGITSQANVAAVKSDLDSNTRKLQLYFTQYGSYPTTLDGNNCPSAPTVDTNYCLKLSPGNTVSTYTGAQSTFSLTIAKGASIVYKITPDAGPTIVSFNSATGGNTTVDVANYNGNGQTWRVHTFNSSSTLTVTSADFPFTVLLVGGGGFGSGFNSYHGAVGGGGGGGRVVEWDDMLTVGSIPVTVGALSVQSVFYGQTAPGGGNGGGAGGGGGSAGGSGGGGGGSHSTGGSGGTAVAGSPRAGYGNAGGNAPTGGMASQAGGSSTFDSRITGAVTRPGQGGGPGSNGSAGMCIVAYRVN